ncbi:hypothetical protein [Geoalkalibacter halelectricus]|uniref:DUF4007 domain-containing protein n=1 Tax=Geoalkalibacter halelectricus TaxID=2847045 RepID=A0ABY5ZKJ0_9BACT|nr:hypothetical protein [Geoalkalibacter halelectricus]MDO3377123.1 hypothetical protein [Geoalkalibacter halelectricus]UWZ79692.1 hypothetical protein L9S41_18720 [Geoalkalibacter halelectricus]
MPELIFSPRFVLQEMLGISFNKLQAEWLQKATQTSQKTVYNWFARGEMAKTSEYRALMDRLSQSELVSACPINRREYLTILKDPDWRDFAASWLFNKDNSFRATLEWMVENLYCNKKSDAQNLDYYRLSSCLPLEGVKKLRENLEKRGISRKRQECFAEIMALILYLALLENEYCELIQQDSSFLEKLLPCYADGESSRILTPINLFFRKLQERVISLSLFKDKNDLVEAIEDWRELECPENAQRILDRYSNSQSMPKWSTISDWGEMLASSLLLQQGKEGGDKITQEKRDSRIKTEVVHLQNLFGFARVLDKGFRLSAGILRKEKRDPVSFFRDEYRGCARWIKNERGG